MTEKPSLIRRLFNGLWAVMSTLYKLFIMLSLVVFVGMLWLAAKGGRAPTVEENMALVVWPSGNLVEQLDHQPGRRLFEQFSGEPASQTLLRDLVEALERGARDDRISTAVLKLDTMWSAGMPQLMELRAAMKTFQDAGKTIHAFSPVMDQSAYLAASAADTVSIDPLGGVFLQGFGLFGNYFREGLEKLGVNVNVFRVGEFKSAVEPFIRNDMSPQARRANQEWLGDLWREYDAQASQSRGLEAGAAHAYVEGFEQGLNQHRGDAAAYALDRGLVTHVESLREFRSRLKAQVGEDSKHGSFRQIHYLHYLRASQPMATEQVSKQIALVVVQGEIVDGRGEFGQAGGETVSRLLEQVRRDNSVAAVVLRVDSPGGSVWASEQIRRGVQALKAAGKPVVASMSSVAASGGYWVSMDADRILAHPSTVTGSIGIFGLIPTIEEPLQRVGIHSDGVGTTSLAGAFRIDRPLSAQVKAIIQSQIDKGYRDFLDGVSQGRGLPMEQVEKLAEGRVWSGQDAQQLGLVDEMGGLRRASEIAAELAGLQAGAWRLVERAPATPFNLGLLKPFFGRLQLDLPLLRNAAIQRLMQTTDLEAWLNRFNDPKGIYAHCMCRPSSGAQQ